MGTKELRAQIDIKCENIQTVLYKRRAKRAVKKLVKEIKK